MGVMMLAEVALGDCHELCNADYNADRLPAGKLSTKGLGRSYPDPSGFISLPNGVKVSSHALLPARLPCNALKWISVRVCVRFRRVTRWRPAGLTSSCSTTR